MKNTSFLIPFITGVMMLSSCDFWRVEPSFRMTAYTPVIVTRESMEKSVIFNPAIAIGTPAKIYFKDNFIYVSERGVGVHVIDNTDKTKPVNTGYISVAGCVDMAIKENTLYVDNVTDLLAINISDIRNFKVNVTKRITDKFPEPAPPDDGRLPEQYLKANRPSNSVIISWKK